MPGFFGVAGIGGAGFVAAGGGGYPWDSIAAVNAAFIADAQYITLNGSDVSNWASQKGSFNLIQGTAADQPAWNATGCNGNGSLEGDGVSEHMTCDALATVASGDDTAFDICVLYKHLSGASGATESLWGFGNSADVDSRMYGHYDGSERWNIARRGDADAATSTVTTTQTYTNTTWHVGYVSYTGTAVSVWVDGAATSLAATALDKALCTLNRMTLMALRLNAAATFFGNVSIGGLWTATSNLIAADRQSIENWAKTRAGV